MGSSARLGRRGWRAAIAGVAAATLATPFLTAAVAPGSQPQHRYLLSVAGEDLSAVTADVTHSGGQVLQSFPVASAVVVTLPDGAAVPTGTVVVPDRTFAFNDTDTADTAPVNTYRDTIRAKSSLTGSGVTVALVDTGVADTGEVDVTHVNVSGAPQGDGLGHGTFLAGLIAGDGASSGGTYAGVAPGAKVLDVQVADAEGGTSLSQVLAGLQAVADRQATDPSVKVVSLALSTGSPLPPWLDPLTRGLERLWARGMTVVVSAGNDGEDAVSSPASDPTLLAVGAADEHKTSARPDDTVADFSSYDTVFGARRPDLVAPGVSLVSLKAPGSIADAENPNASVGDKYFKGTGTSMSSAVTAGAVAALTAARPTLAPNDVKRLLVGTAYDTAGLTVRQGAGAGGLDLGAAVTGRVNDMPKLAFEPVSSRFGPSEADAETWAEFAAAWEAGNLRAVVAAWVRLSPQSRRWAANAWSVAVLVRALSLDEGTFLGRRWAGRRWAIDHWNGRRWADDSWVGRRWAVIDWSGRRWAESTWLTTSWEGRRWAAEDWLAFAWTLRATNTDDVISDMWRDEDDRSSWNGRRWADVDWAGRRWAYDAWDGRRWADYVWDGRRWANGEWDGRRWADGDWEGRRWADRDWNGRRWADHAWDGRRWAGRRWAAGEWDGRRWAEFAWDGRRWANDAWDGRRWAVTGWGS